MYHGRSFACDYLVLDVTCCLRNRPKCHYPKVESLHCLFQPVPLAATFQIEIRLSNLLAETSVDLPAPERK